MDADSKANNFQAIDSQATYSLFTDSPVADFQATELRGADSQTTVSKAAVTQAKDSSL
jgi:hypothetical protein